MCTIIAKNLISVSKLAQDNVVCVEFDSDYYLIKDKATGCTLLKGELSDGLYWLWLNGVRVLKGGISEDSSTQHINKGSTAFILSRTRVNVAESRVLWHKRLGDPSLKTLELIIRECNIPTKMNEQLEFCESFQLGKAHTLPFPNSVAQASENFDLVHTDVWGLALITSTNGYRYYVSFLDDYSRYL